MMDILLSDGNKTPPTGFGTYQLTGRNGILSMTKALQLGYRLLDTASFYNNEKETGEAIKACGTDRDKITVTTKLWKSDMGYASTKAAFYSSLKNLDLDYIDQYLIHWPATVQSHYNWQQVNAESWRAMEELKDEGKIRTIGVCNFWPIHLEALLNPARTIPAINQIEFHPGYGQPAVTDYCRKNTIVIEAWSPLARGALFNNPVIKQIASTHSKTVSQVCLRWIIQHGVIPLPKATRTERIKENLDIFDFTLTGEEMQKINQLPETGFSGEYPDTPGRFY